MYTPDSRVLPRYVQAAAAAGWTTFRYDRLGTGLSDHPDDGFRAVQAPTDLAILQQLATMLRTGGTGSTSYSKVIGVCHSYGSEQLAALSGTNTSAGDALIHTGFRANSSSTGTFIAGGLYSRAPDVELAEFATLPGSFNAAVFLEACASEQPATLGVFGTMGVLSGSPSGFTGPVHVVTGDKDLPLCGAQCNIVPLGVDKTILELTQPMVFPRSTNFSIYSPANTGHGVNLHYSPPDAYPEIRAWLETAS